MKNHVESYSKWLGNIVVVFIREFSGPFEAHFSIRRIKDEKENEDSSGISYIYNRFINGARQSREEYSQRKRNRGRLYHFASSRPSYAKITRLHHELGIVCSLFTISLGPALRWVRASRNNGTHLRFTSSSQFKPRALEQRRCFCLLKNCVDKKFLKHKKEK